MFLKTEERPQGEVAPVKVLRPSEAVRLGAERYEQCRRFYDESGRFCAVCGAVKVLGGDPMNLWESSDGHGDYAIYSWLSKNSPAPVHIWAAASGMHYGGADSLQVAAWLEGQGY